MPSRKQKLVTSMLKSAKFRGHKMKLGDFDNLNRRFWGEWSCQRCGMTAYVDTHPMPNSIDVYGQAVALNCENNKGSEKMNIEQFKVIKPVDSSEHEQGVKNKEGLWFYHSYYRTELELLEIAHNMLLEIGEHNYRQTREYRDIESIQKQLYADSTPDKIRLNCPFSGKFEWASIDDLHEVYTDMIDTLSNYLTEVYGIDDYSVCYYEGEWGLWPNFDF